MGSTEAPPFAEIRACEIAAMAACLSFWKRMQRRDLPEDWYYDLPLGSLSHLPTRETRNYH
jgi:hypothetical protein